MAARKARVAKTRGAARRRDPSRTLRALSSLSSDWYWEQDESLRFVRVETRNGTRGERALAASIVGKTRWESGVEIEGGWKAHRAILKARKPFRDALMWRTLGDGSRRYLSVSGEPVFDSNGKFSGYRGIGRDITAQKRAEQVLRLEHHVALSLADARTTEEGLIAVMRAFCEAEGWACGRYLRVDEAAGVLRMQVAWCVAEPAIEAFIEQSRPLTYISGQGLAGMVWQTGEPVWTSDTRTDPRVHAKVLAINTVTRGALVFPVSAAGKIIGVLSFTSREVREPDERMRQAARVIASQLGQFMQRKQAEEALRESESRFRSLTQMSSDFFWATDAQHRFTQMVHGPNYVAKFGRELLGKTAWDLPASAPDEAGWAQLRASFDAHDAFRDFEFARRWPDGSTRYFSVSGEARFAEDGEFLGYRGVGRETTEIALAREHVASLAYRDTLTGLANRTSLGPAFEQAVERSRRRGAKLATLFIDLDGFKPINDRHGHTAGDSLLVEVARRLRISLRASDLVARLGGDEFFVVLEEVNKIGTLEAVAGKLLDEIGRSYDLGAGVQARISASMGISVFPDDANDAATLMKHSDSAMYAAKQAGKNGFRFYAAVSAARKASSAPRRKVKKAA